MAPKKSAEVSLVEVTYAPGSFSTTIFLDGVNVAFTEGKATVTTEVEAKLRELGYIV